MKTFAKFNLMAIAVTVLCSFFASCQFINPSKYALDQYRDVCHEIILNGDICSDREWEVYKEKHANAIEEINKYKDNYTSEEITEIGRLEGKTSKIYIKREGADSLKQLYEGVKDLIDEGIGILDGVLS